MSERLPGTEAEWLCWGSRDQGRTRWLQHRLRGLGFSLHSLPLFPHPKNREKGFSARRAVGRVRPHQTCEEPSVDLKLSDAVVSWQKFGEPHLRLRSPSSQAPARGLLPTPHFFSRYCLGCWPMSISGGLRVGQSWTRPACPPALPGQAREAGTA